jgi:nucleotide-binding universal stress UspA family protein
MYQRILIPLDGSKASGAALKEALKLAREQRARAAWSSAFSR